MNLFRIKSIVSFHTFWNLFSFHFESLSLRQWVQNEKKKSAQKLKKLNKFFNTE
jgi:hypothetical protein